MRCDNCEYAYKTPLEIYCYLTKESVEITECHFDEKKSIDDTEEWLVKQMYL